MGNVNRGLAAVALLAVGMAVGLAVSNGDGADPAPDPEAGRLRAEVAALSRRVEELTRERWRPTPAELGPEGFDVDPARIRKLAPEGATPDRLSDAEARARALRRAALERARNAERDAARQLVVEMEAERRLLEDRARGGTMQLLRGLAEKPARLYSVVATREAFLPHFARHEQGPTIPDAHWNPHRDLQDGATVVFGEGVRTWDAEGWRHKERFPKDLAFRGAGMDRTLLRLNEISSRREVKSLTFEDLTLDCQNNYFTDLRSENPVTIRMTRCRVVGFDMAAGGSVMLAARTAAFYAEDCRFEAGFSRAGAGSGNLFRVRSGLLVRMDGCTVVGPFSSVFDADDAATYQFTACTFERMSPRLRPVLEKPPAGIRLESCRVVYATDEKVEAARDTKRALTEINPAWR